MSCYPKLCQNSKLKHPKKRMLVVINILNEHFKRSINWSCPKV